MYIFFIGTFDVQNLHYQQNISELSLTCIFTFNSKAKGCLVLITNVDTLQTTTMKIPRLQPDANASQCITPLNNGEHVVSAYDWEEDGGISAEPAVTSNIIINNITRFILMFYTINNNNHVHIIFYLYQCHHEDFLRISTWLSHSYNHNCFMMINIYFLFLKVPISQMSQGMWCISLI